MAKTSFFTWSDYRSAAQRLTVRPERLSAGVIVLLVVVQSLATGLSWSLSWLPETSWAKEGWGPVLLLLLPLLVALQIFTVVTIRQIWGGRKAGWGVGWAVFRTWTALAAGLVLPAILFSLPTWLPPLATGFWEGITNAPSATALTARAAWGSWQPVADIVQTLLFSLLGGVYLWTFPAAVFALETPPWEVHRWARSLAWRTWPLAAGFAGLTLVGFVWDRSGPGYQAWLLVQAVAAQGFVFAQTVLLAEKARRTDSPPA